jgi:[ribosomal protein S5]-alanine N-acetyltransferase
MDNKVTLDHACAPAARAYFLKTGRLGFSKWQASDLNLAFSLWGDPQVTRMICASGKFTDQEVIDRLHREIKNDDLYGVQYWPIFSLETNQLIGCCGLRPCDLDEGIYELGFHLKPSYWGQHYASEAAQAVLQYAFETLKVKTVLAGHHPQNAASKKVLERSGFIYSHDEFYPPTGLYHPSYQYKKT